MENELTRILLICWHFPPVNEVGSHRPFGFAKAWMESGAEVRIVTPSLQGRVLHTSEISDFPGREKMTVRYIGEDRGTARSPGSSVERAVGQSRLRGLLFDLKASLQYSPFLAGFGTLSCPSHLWVRRGIAACMNVYDEWSFNWVVSSFGPAACHRIAAAVSNRTGAYWLADFRDLWAAGVLARKHPGISQLESLWERKVVKSADLLSTVSEPLAAQLRSTFPQKPVVVAMNGFDEGHEQEASAEPSEVRVTEHALEIIYTGSVDLNGYNLREFLRAFRDVRAHRQRAVLRFFTKNTQSVDALKVELGLGDAVQTCGYLPRRKVRMVQRSAGLLLFLQWDVPGQPGNVSGKFFEYLAAGRPIVISGGASDDIPAQIGRRTGTAVYLGRTSEKVTCELEKKINEPELGYSPDAGEIRKYARTAQAKILMCEMKRIQSRNARG